MSAQTKALGCEDIATSGSDAALKKNAGFHRDKHFKVPFFC